MDDRGVVIGVLAPSPVVDVRSELLGELGERLRQAAREQFVAAAERIRPEAAVGRIEPVNHPFHAELPDECLRLLRHHQVPDVRHHAPLPHFVDARRHGIGVHAVIPAREQLARAAFGV